ncbi:cytochrome P450 [Fomes fomentarius]|nr:cytochrome P450 [Fomes fomentarius]
MLDSQHATLFTLVTGAVSVYFVRRLLRKSYSPLDNISGPPSGSIWAGNIMQLFSQEHWDFVRHIADTYGPVAKLHGFFGAKTLHIYDLKAMHSISIKDQESYYRGGEFIGTMLLLIGPGLLSTHGDSHKKQRKMLNPVFSVAHIRNITPLFYNVTEKFVAAINSQVEGGPQELDMMHWIGRIALELIGQGGMGHSFDPLVDGSQDTLTEVVKAFVPSFEKIQWARFLFPYLPYLGPSWFRRAILDLIPSKTIQKAKEVTDVVNKPSEELVNAKKAALGKGEEDVTHRVGEGKDVLSILLKGNTTAAEEDKLPDEELYAHILTFILAGTDTTSNTLARILHQLADHQDVQEKLRKEIHEAQERWGQAIPYDELCALPYMDAVCRETLRIFTPLNVIAREVLHDTILPLSSPVRGIDGTKISEIPVQKGTSIFCHLGEANADKALWGQDAREWKPERWLKPLPREVEEARVPGVYAHMMTFIGGPYACMYVSIRFAQVFIQVVLALLLSSLKFERSKTPISWKFGGVAYPTSGEAGHKAEMHLVVSRVCPLSMKDMIAWMCRLRETNRTYRSTWTSAVCTLGAIVTAYSRDIYAELGIQVKCATKHNSHGSAYWYLYTSASFTTTAFASPFHKTIGSVAMTLWIAPGDQLSSKVTATGLCHCEALLVRDRMGANLICYKNRRSSPFLSFNFLPLHRYAATPRIT